MLAAGTAIAAALLCAAGERTTRWGEVRSVVRCETSRAVIDFDPVGLDAAERETFVRLADQGIADLERLLSPSPAGSPGTGRPVRYVVSARVGMSRTYGRTVLLPLRRVRDREAPYLHETVHALVPSPHASTWLTEGIACYLESWLAENVGGYDAHVFTRAGDRGVHRAARSYLATDLGRAVLPWVGVPGQPPRLDEERARVARPFYVLSHSFTKHLVEKLGLPAVVGLVRERDPEGGLLRLSGRTALDWRAEWLVWSTLGP